MAQQNKKILVVGGAGYIGSHMTQFLFDQGYQPIIFDKNALKPFQHLPKVRFIKGDLRNYEDIYKALKQTTPDVVMYFAGLIIAPESAYKPIEYYDNNVTGGINLIKAMQALKIKKIIFSSTAAVYGNPKTIPIKEDAALNPINVYGKTKLILENIIQDLAWADPSFSYIMLRYFNAAGAHASGQLGECHEPETHLIPNILRTLTGKNKKLEIYGNDYPTKDGSCIRDYIHVEYLCEAHFLAIKALEKNIKNNVFNLGSGSGYSVNEIIKAVEKITKKKVAYKICPRRPGDPAKLVASSSKAQKILRWKPTRDLDTIITSAWMWEQQLGE